MPPMSERTRTAMATGLGLALLTTACVDFNADAESAENPREEAEAPEEDGATETPEAAETSDASEESEPEDTAENEGQQVTIESVAVAVPDGWFIQETPSDYNPSAWSAGAFDDDESPNEFIRVIPAMDISSSAADMGATQLIAEAEFAESYGENFETTGRGDGDINGAEDVHVVDFRYFEGDNEVLGRWWVFADVETGIIAAVEHAGRADVSPDFDSTAEGIVFTP